MVTSGNLEGVYKLEFASNLNFRGSGLVTLKDGKFRGNDHCFEWRGEYSVHDDQFAAEISVKQFAGGVSIFGLLSEFNLVVEGPLTLPRLTLKGHRKEEPGDKVVVLMTRRDDGVDNQA